MGMDSSDPRDSTKQPLSAELVLLFDLKRNKLLHWTGKSYPAHGQERGLVYFSLSSKDYSHFIELDDVGKVMILGCHDLTLFSPRSHANVKHPPRKPISDEFRQAMKKKQPEIVLHHPRWTLSERNWNIPIASLIRQEVAKYASAGRYYDGKNNHKSIGSKDDRKRVLERTVYDGDYGSSIDFIVELERQRRCVGH